MFGADHGLVCRHPPQATLGHVFCLVPPVIYFGSLRALELPETNRSLSSCFGLHTSSPCFVPSFGQGQGGENPRLLCSCTTSPVFMSCSHALKAQPFHPPPKEMFLGASRAHKQSAIHQANLGVCRALPQRRQPYTVCPDVEWKPNELFRES